VGPVHSGSFAVLSSLTAVATTFCGGGRDGGDEVNVKGRWSESGCGECEGVVNFVTPQVFSSLIALHLHKHKQASFISCISL
jgi:hypothetical protein